MEKKTRILVISRGFIRLSANNNLAFFNENDGPYIEGIHQISKVTLIAPKTDDTSGSKWDFTRSYRYTLPNSIQRIDLCVRRSDTFRTALRCVRAALNADVVYIMGPSTAKYLVAIACASMMKKVVLYIGHENTHRTKWRRLETAIETAAIYLASKIICTGRDLLLKISSRANAESKTEAARPILKPGIEARNPQAVKSNVPIYLSVGALIDRKNQIELLRASKVISYPHEVHIAGFGVEDFIRKHFDEIQSTRNIHFHGHISDQSTLSALYDSATAVVLTSHSEGYPRVFHEAAIHKKCIVSSNIPAAAELRDTGYPIFIYDIGDVTSLINALSMATRANELMCHSISNGPSIKLENAIEQITRIMSSMAE